MRRFLSICSLMAGITFPGTIGLASLKPLPPRQVVELDGIWEVEEGVMNRPPERYRSTVAVPGLLDMATPAFSEVGKPSGRREAFWYRRTFRIKGEIPEIAMLKINKARYGTRVILNGRLVGDQVACFTPSYFDVSPHLKGGDTENELIIRVGADRSSLPTDVPSGWDFEKYLYLPGIYDSVQLILTGAPWIQNVQAVPDIAGAGLRVVAEVLAGRQSGELEVSGTIAEAASGNIVGHSTSPALMLGARERGTIDFNIALDSPHLWSPEDPFLYELRLSTRTDAAATRFGMRSFGLDRASGRALLNGKPYFLRGSNVTIYRFFEDADRRDRPWREEWVRRLHRKFKTMHWNTLRYCIGFPPEIWYDIADEEGFLIQDEFPIWLLDKAPEDPSAEKIIPQYRAWMRERWNHPCVVIWDAQNESFTPETGKALTAVRDLDLSKRPWENGWAEPQSPNDLVEAHPYLFIREWSGKEPFKLSELATHPGVPSLQKPQQKLKVPILINEYAWLWLTREGNPTCLTDKIYRRLLGPDSTVEERRSLYARYLAALTEFWRSHREVAGVLHFCALGYSRPGDKPRPEGGATSDHFIDIEQLLFEPHFERYVRDAFNPLGITLDFWEEEVRPEVPLDLRVVVINDLAKEWRGTLKLVLKGEEPESVLGTADCAVEPLGRETRAFRIKTPGDPGRFDLVAETLDHTGVVVRSVRQFSVR